MATINLTLTYPDGQGARILTAIKARMVQEKPTIPAPTNADAIAWVKENIAQTIRNTVREYEAREAVQVAIADAAALPLDIT